MPSADEFQAGAERHLERLAGTAGGAAALEAAPARVRDSIGHVFACSDFVAEACIRDPALLAAPLESARSAAPDPSLAEPEFATALRRWRRREMVRIAWRDLAGWATLEETLAALSGLADAAIASAEQFARASLVATFGEPRAPGGAVQPFVIVAMGKLGGAELNFSSDVDLVFLFPEPGETDGPQVIANEEFFVRLGQAVIRLLDARSAEGIVFRVDLRLRPFGESGPLATSFRGLEDYLQSQGRDWERYAWVKARPVTGVAAFAEIRASAVRPFVFRRYLDFGVFESLREMKALIEREVQRRDLEDDVKLGAGGIREIEFIVQAFQLIRGGQDPRLQQPSLLAVLPLLEGGKGLPRLAITELGAAYAYLRRLENCLQMRRDEQTHRLPAAPSARLQLARALGESSWDALRGVLDEHRARVVEQFRSLILAEEERAREGPQRAEFAALWDAAAPVSDLAEWLGRTGFAPAGPAAGLLDEFRESAAVRRLDTLGRRRLQDLLPPLLGAIAPLADALEVLRRTLRILEAIGSRSAYFALLREAPRARRRLCEICATGDFLAGQIALHPLLLDELLDEQLFEELPGRAALEAELKLRMQAIPEDDPERQVESLRFFQRAAVFRIAVADLTGRLPLMRVSDRLTDVAELIVGEAMALAWAQMTGEFGTPRCGEERRAVRICAVGYGKLGGHELGYGSDLDLVFLHDSTGPRQETDAGVPMDNGLFFVRLAQRILHLLTVHSPAGRLYEVDVRLRPSGKGGMLITQIDAFASYQRSEAWTWEHQALLHARAVAGDSSLRARFEQIRVATLTGYVRLDRLAAEVSEMRVKMRRGQTPPRVDGFHVKRDPGGITDIEFLAQFWALRLAHDHPPVVTFADTIRQLESVASADLVPQATVDLLTNAYRSYRAYIHHRSLERAEPVAAPEAFAVERAAILRIWQATFPATFEFAPAAPSV